MTAVYLDSSALIKLVVEEVESAALRQWLRARPEAVWYTSTLAEVEVLRAVARAHAKALGEAQAVLDLVVQVEMDEEVRRTAATLLPPGLRSLDAIHLATALLLHEEITGFLVYDAKLSAACAHAGLVVQAPAPR